MMMRYLWQFANHLGWLREIGWVCGLSVALTACQTTQPSLQYDKTALAQIRTQMAGQYILLGNLDEAKRQLDMAMAADAHFAPSYDMMAVLLQTEGSANNLAQADEFFRKAIHLDRDFMRAYNNYGVYLSQVGRAGDAVGYFEVAGNHLGYEGRVQALENLGFTWRRLGNVKRANDAFYRAIDGGSVNLAVYEIILSQLISQNDVNRANAIFERLSLHVLMDSLSDKLLVMGIHLAGRAGDDAKSKQLTQILQEKYPNSGKMTITDVLKNQLDTDLYQ